MFEWLKDANPNLVTVLVLVPSLAISAFFGIPALRAKGEVRRRERILDPSTWDRILSSLQTDRAERYFGAIEASVAWFDRVYGPKVLSYRAYRHTNIIASVYAILSLLIGWVIFDAGELGGLVFLPEKWPWWQRMAASLAVIAGPGLMLVGMGPKSHIKEILARRLEKQLAAAMRKSGPFARIIVFFYEIVPEALGLLPIFLGFIITVAVAEIGAVSGAFYIVVCILFYLFSMGYIFGKFTEFGPLLAFGTIVLVSVSPVLAYAIYLGVLRPNTSTGEFPSLSVDFSTLSEIQTRMVATVLLFFVILPQVNAWADFLSVAATRQFLRRIAAHRKGAWPVLGGVLIDLVIAALCLALLLWSIIVTLDIWRDLAPATLPFDWRAYRDELCAGDWQRGTMLWLMLSTTLAPTALHLAAGFGAVFAHSGQIDEKIAAILRPARDALVAKYGAVAFETDHEARAKSVLNADLRHSLEDFLGHKEAAQRWLTVALFIGFMVLMMGAVILAAHQFALPQLCPGL